VQFLLDPSIWTILVCCLLVRRDFSAFDNSSFLFLYLTGSSNAFNLPAWVALLSFSTKNFNWSFSSEYWFLVLSSSRLRALSTPISMVSCSSADNSLLPHSCKFSDTIRWADGMVGKSLITFMILFLNLNEWAGCRISFVNLRMLSRRSGTFLATSHAVDYLSWLESRAKCGLCFCCGIPGSSEWKLESESLHWLRSLSFCYAHIFDSDYQNEKLPVLSVII